MKSRGGDCTLPSNPKGPALAYAVRGFVRALTFSSEAILKLHVDHPTGRGLEGSNVFVRHGSATAPHDAFPIGRLVGMPAAGILRSAGHESTFSQTVRLTPYTTSTQLSRSSSRLLA